MRVVPSICTFCGVSCGLGLQVEDGRVIGVEPQPGHPVSQGQLCAKGWATSFAIELYKHLTQPMIKAQGRVAEEFRVALDRLGAPDNMQREPVRASCRVCPGGIGGHGVMQRVVQP